jgi:hypothetical protein
MRSKKEQGDGKGDKNREKCNVVDDHEDRNLRV